jgi:flagellar FliJ protein
MNKRLKRLEPVQRLKHFHERDAARRLGEDQRALDAQRSRLEELLRYREDYLARYQQVLAAGGLGGQPLQEYRVFLERLDQAIGQQRLNVERGEQACVQARDQWLATRTDVKVIDKVVEQSRQSIERQRMKREQGESDERAQYRKPPEQG